MHQFTVRNGYGSKSEPLIEFLNSTNDALLAELKYVFAKIDAKLISKDNLWQNDEIILNFSSPFGDFEYSYSVWDTQFIMSLNSNKTIPQIALVLNKNKNFDQIMDIN